METVELEALFSILYPAASLSYQFINVAFLKNTQEIKY